MTTRIWITPRPEDGYAQLVISIAGKETAFDVSPRMLVAIARMALESEEFIREHRRTVGGARLALVQTPHGPSK